MGLMVSWTVTLDWQVLLLLEISFTVIVTTCTLAVSSQLNEDLLREKTRSLSAVQLSLLPLSSVSTGMVYVPELLR